MVTVAAFVLAAGASSRFSGGDKLLADFRGRPLVHWAVAAAAGAGFDRIHVVWGATDLTAHVPEGIDLVHNAAWDQGQATSLARAVEVAGRAGDDAFVVGLADQPLIGAEAWRRVGASTSPIAVATYGGRRRNPVRFGASVWDLLPSVGDEGARRLVRERDDLVEEIPCPGVPIDIDTVEDLARWS